VVYKLRLLYKSVEKDENFSKFGNRAMSVRIMEIYRTSAAFDEFLNLQPSPSSLKFKGNIELRAI